MALFFIKKYWLSCLLFVCALACLVKYKTTDIYVDESGILVEPFYLIPLFYLFVFSSFMVLMITCFKHK